MGIDVLLWVVSSIACIYAYLLFSNKLRNLPPGPVGLPIVGSLFELGHKPNESLSNLSWKYGPLMTLRLGFRTTVVVSSAKMAEEVLRKHDQAFAGRTVIDAVRASGHNKASLVWNQLGPRWRDLRQICNAEMFSAKRLDALRGLREQKVRSLTQRVRAACADGRPVDIGECAFVTAINLVSNTIFSQDVVDFESESAGEFKSLVWDIMETAGRPNLSDYFPALRLVDPQGLRRHMTVCLARLHALFNEMIDKRLESYATNALAENHDFLDALLQHVRNSGEEFNREDINPLLVDMFVAGSDTSSATVEWAMAELLRNPEKMATARSELDYVIDRSRVVMESDIPHLPYLHAVVKETLRLHAPVPFLIPHRADEIVEVAGFSIPKHTQLLVNAWAIGRDSGFWENPNTFLPERFVGSDVNFKGQHLQFIPFGAGRRICPGLPLALRMVHMMLASLIHSFSWKLPDGIASHQLDMSDKYGLTLQKAVPLRVVPSL